MKLNLNQELIRGEGGESGIEQQDFSCSSGPKIEVFFKNLAENLIEKLRGADLVVGCVAWLTCPKILRALQEKPVSIVVQKEDWLRPAPTGAGRLYKKRVARKLCEIEMQFG